MQTRIAKVASIAAVIAVAALAVTFWSRSSSPAYAITDLVRQFEQAHTIHVQGWNYFPEHKMPDGSDIPPSPIDNWTDVVNARSRYTRTSLAVGVEVNVIVSEVVRDGPSQIRIDHGDNKSVTYFHLSEYQQKLETRRISEQISGQLFGNITLLSNATVVGAERIDGLDCDIWQSDDAEGSRWKQWLSADTGRLIRAQVLRKVDSGQWKVATDYPLIEYNVEPPEGTFSLEPPEGYTVHNSPETAHLIELGACGCIYPGLNVKGVRYQAGARVAFALADGSVVVGWQSYEYTAPEKQALFFEGVTFGGPLPELPLEFYALIPANGSSEPLYAGHHLAFTRKQGKFFEWSLYVPDGTPPADVQETGYEMLHRCNVEFARLVTISHMTVEPEFTIETAEEFDEWVLGAMADLADDGTAPEGLTYERVLDLAQEIRTSYTR